MVQDNINEIIQKAINSKKNNNLKKEISLIANLYKSIKDNYSLFETTNKIDLSNNNGFNLDFEIMEKILNRYTKIQPIINDDLGTFLTDDNLIFSKMYASLGIINVVFDGNTYTMLEMILLGILTHNTIIFSYDKYMCGTNGLLITLAQAVIEKEGYVKEMFQHSYMINLEDYFTNFKTIDKTIIIGDNEFQNKYLKLCGTNALVSGYNNYDMYIDDLTHINVIKQILNQKLDINVYINSELDFKVDKAIVVDDIDEAITQMNYNGSCYSTAIFTQSSENASSFLKKINSKYIMINASPTLERQLDIQQEDLLKIKNVVMPNIYNFNGSNININV